MWSRSAASSASPVGGQDDGPGTGRLSGVVATRPSLRAAIVPGTGEAARPFVDRVPEDGAVPLGRRAPPPARGRRVGRGGGMSTRNLRQAADRMADAIRQAGADIGFVAC